MTAQRVLIVGAGQAGAEIAVQLRSLDFTGEISLIGAEPYLPYSRPPLSKGIVTGVDSSGVQIRPADFYAEREIELETGTEVTEVDLDAGRARLGDGRTVGFDRLALATGARVRKLTVPGADRAGVIYLRTLDDALNLAKVLPVAKRIAIIGAGFIGLEAASIATQRGIDVVVVDALERAAARVVPPPLSRAIREHHERNGVTFHFGATVVGIDPAQSSGLRVTLTDGVGIDADLVLVGVGVTPNAELARSINLDVRSGIVVDAAAVTSDPRVVAAGDCTVIVRETHATGGLHLGSVHGARVQAAAAARTIAGLGATSEAVPWFWSDQGELKLQTVGLGEPGDDLLLINDAAAGVTVLHFRDDRLVAAGCIGRAADFAQVRRALSRGVVRTRADFQTGQVALKDILNDA